MSSTLKQQNNLKANLSELFSEWPFQKIYFISQDCCHHRTTI